MGEDDSANQMARFTEMTGVVHENVGDKYAVIVAARNQGDREKEGNNINLNMEKNQENLDVILEAKRKRVWISQNEEEYGPELMQTDGPKNNTELALNESNESKNL
ncbi:hypothetical protein AgCh_024534 [Apium graveolens]